MKMSIKSYAVSTVISLILGATAATAGHSVDRVIYSDDSADIVALGGSHFESGAAPSQAFDAVIYSDESQDLVLLGRDESEQADFAAFTVAYNDTGSTGLWDEVIYVDEDR